MIKLFKGIDYGFKDVDLKQGIVTGLFSHFNSVDNDGDIVQETAFNKSISERGPMGKNLIAHLLDHKKDKAVATIQVLEARPDLGGGYYESKAGLHNDGQDWLKMVESGIIKNHSFGYKVIKAKYEPEKKANVLQELYLYEISSLQFLGANENTPILGVKSLTDLLDYMDLVEKFVRNSDATDKTLIILSEKLKSLQELIKPDASTLPNQEADENKQIIELLKNFGK
jgi:HK97 family phage prohead protease